MSLIDREPGALLDISPLVSARTAVFPGDTPFSRRVALDFVRGDNLVLSAIESTVHVGAHADAPSHYTPKGATIDGRALARYVGPCQVVHVRVARGARIRPSDVPEPLVAPRVLFRTGTYPDPDQWNGDFAALSPDLVHWLADAGVTLVGIDTPSIDPADDAVLHAHAAVAARDLAVLEGLVLDHVAPGRYGLIALPLRLEGADASPVRAVLIAEGGGS